MDIGSNVTVIVYFYQCFCALEEFIFAHRTGELVLPYTTRFSFRLFFPSITPMHHGVFSSKTASDD
jgi:hypothetical protein